jgi:3-oxoadipate enol-lactonase
MIDTFERQDVRIGFEVTGTGRPVLLGHSFLCDRSMWRHQVPHLAEQWQVVNIDARGHGASSRLRGPCTMDDLVADALAVADHLGIERAVWGGLSMGGMVAMGVALRAPERVSALMLLDTDSGSETAWRRFKYGALAQVVRMVGLGPVMGQVEAQMFGRTARRERPALVRDWSAGLMNRTDVPSILAINAALKARDDVTSHLKTVDVPALVLVGSEDVSTPPARARRLADALPNARLVQIPGVGHLSSLERPEDVTEAMLAFLDSMPPADGPAGPTP